MDGSAQAQLERRFRPARAGDGRSSRKPGTSSAMSKRFTAHSTFVIERELPGRPAYAFRFWSEPDMKKRWAACHADWQTLEYAFDFRVGGSEVNRLRTPEGVIHGFRSYYLDIVAGSRIIYAYEMSVDEERISASL